MFISAVLVVGCDCSTVPCRGANSCTPFSIDSVIEQSLLISLLFHAIWCPLPVPSSVCEPRWRESLFDVLVNHLRSQGRSEEHTSELQSLMRISYAVFCLKK